MQSVTLIADEQCVDFAKEFNEKILQMQQSGEYWITDMGYQIGEDLWKLKEASGMKYKDIAAKLGKSKKWVKRVMYAEDDITIKEIALVAFAMGYYLSKCEFKKTTEYGGGACN